MSVLAVLRSAEEAPGILSWALVFAAAKKTSLSVLCWTYSPTIEYPLLTDGEPLPENDVIVDAVRSFMADSTQNEVEVEIRRALHPDATAAAIQRIQAEGHELVIAAATDETGRTEASYRSNPLLRQSPCATMILFRASVPARPKRRILVASSDAPHEPAAVALTAAAAKADLARVTVVRTEDDAAEEALEIGRRSLQRLMREAGVKPHENLKRKVLIRDEHVGFDLADKNDLVIVGPNQQKLVHKLHLLTKKPCVAVLKRTPPLRRISQGMLGRKMSPADYAELIQSLRIGARLDSDFVVMLGLAAAIATLGLIQDSAAVVIGSMLLAPLMTPMVACGLAVAQGNKKLGRQSMKSIVVGFLITLIISALIGYITPGEELTSQIVARGDPNILDLLIAFASAMAAAYAMARPSIAGAVAGVAIATALVPPLCAMGTSLAYREYFNAQGAGLLFVTNVVAIVLGAALTFRMLGVTSERAGVVERKWVYRVTVGGCLTLILLALPLQLSFNRVIDEGKAQPRTYPLRKSVEDAVAEYVQRIPDARFVAGGRPSSISDDVDVSLVLSSPVPLPRSIAQDLIEIVRQKMDNPELVVEVHCVIDAWED